MIQDLFPPVTLSQTEEDIVAEKLSDPSVKKYFRRLAYTVAVDLAVHGEPSEGESLEAFARKQAALRGQLDTLHTLFLIPVPAKKQD